MVRTIILAAALLASAPAHALDADRTLNECMQAFIESGKKGGPAGDDWMWYCMQRNHFAFCDQCKIFNGPRPAPLCKDDEDRLYRPICWQETH